MTRVVDARLADAFRLYEALIAGLDEPDLELRLGDLPSNAIGDQLWCVVGARESYARAIARGEWAGFSCSLSAADTRLRSRVAEALEATALETLGVLAALATLTEAQDHLAHALLEHEAQHHGQLIR